MHNISQAKLLFFGPAMELSATSCTHKVYRMPLEQENLFLCLPPQELTDLEILAPSNSRITFKKAKCDMS